MPSKKRPRAGTKTVVMDLPEFGSEAEEAAFWDANPDLITAVFKAARSSKGNRIMLSEPISIRIPINDLTRLKALATKKGLGYQTLAKSMIHEGITREYSAR